MKDSELKFFNSIAPKWDDNEVLSLPDKINEILDRIDIPEGARVLDLGTGTGVLLPYLAERVGEHGSITAVDLCDAMLSRAKEKYSSLSPRVRFIKADFEATPLPGRYDVIMMYCVYPHLEHPFETIARLCERNLTDGGSIYVAFPCDENFINNVHGHKKVEAERLPGAFFLAGQMRREGLRASVAAYSRGMYIVRIHPLPAEALALAGNKPA